LTSGFSGFSSALKTAKAVQHGQQRWSTPVNRRVHEKACSWLDRIHKNSLPRQMAISQFDFVL